MTTDAGKRVSWVELYFDLVFVFAISQAARGIAERPTWSGLVIAFGVFLTLYLFTTIVTLKTSDGDEVTKDKPAMHDLLEKVRTIAARH